MKQLTNSLRVKVTGHCNKDCKFCHKEGNMEGIDELQYSEQLQRFIQRVHSDLNIDIISITGGEPLLHRDLINILSLIKLHTNISNFSLTTNGTINKDFLFWAKMKQCGLYKVNLSISDIIEKHLPGRNSEFEIQMCTIMHLNRIGIAPTINIVAYKNEEHLVRIISKLLTQNHLKFDLAILPNLINKYCFNQSENVISNTLTALGCRKVNSMHRKGTSNTVFEYISAQGVLLQTKNTKRNGHPVFLKKICYGCAKKVLCQEGFYGIRLESKAGQLLVRLCLYRSDAETLFPINEFFESEIYQDLKTIWGL